MTLPPEPAQLLAIAAAAWAATALLAAWARRVGWVDAPTARDAHRKRQPRPVPTVGGAVVLAALVLPASFGELPRTLAGTGGPAFVTALAVAFGLGLADDLLPRGLDWRVKLAGQCAAGTILAQPLLAGGSPLPGLVLAGFAVLAQNAVNTFDNADGAVASLGLLALGAPAPAAAAALAGFLPANLGRDRAGARAYLGDAGAHAVGIAIAACPLAWPALALPLCDLARVAFERVRARQRPWVGDRRHLAHRLEERGWSPGGVALALSAIAAPSVLLGLAGAPAAGLAATGLLFAVAVWVSRPSAGATRSRVRARCPRAPGGPRDRPGRGGGVAELGRSSPAQG